MLVRKVNMRPSSSHLALGFLALLASACSEHHDAGASPNLEPEVAPLPPISLNAPGATAGSPGSPPWPEGSVPELRATVVADFAAPLIAGTLLVTRDGITAVASDPDRARIFLVDLRDHTVRAVAALPGDELGRVAEGPEGTLFVVARRGGALLILDRQQASVRARIPVCNEPRGLAYDGERGLVHVACRSGQLVSLGASSLVVRRRLSLDSDLRDVLVRGAELIVTRFRNAEVLVIGESGLVIERDQPAPSPGCADATVAFRAVLSSDGSVLIAHQSSSNASISTSPSGYGLSCAGGLVGAFLSRATPHQPRNLPSSVNGFPQDPVDSRPSQMSIESTRFDRGTGPFDVAVDASGARIAFLLAGNSYLGREKPLFVLNPTAVPSPSVLSTSAPMTPETPGLGGTPVSVAFDSRGQWLVQSREPATLEFEDGTVVSLSNESIRDTGVALFHLNTGLGISCASCHPEGGEDGHTWHFANGLRRTQPLEGGVLDRAPFHWSGEFATLTDLVGEVMVRRMGLPFQPSASQVDALGHWLQRIPKAQPADGLNFAAVALGKRVFEDTSVGCATCHSGSSFTDNQLHDVGTGGAFSTPTLLGVGLRSPLFHDGCAINLDARFGHCGGGEAHGKVSQLSDADVANLLSYLRSL